MLRVYERNKMMMMMDNVMYLNFSVAMLNYACEAGSPALQVSLA